MPMKTPTWVAQSMVLVLAASASLAIMHWSLVDAWSSIARNNLAVLIVLTIFVAVVTFAILSGATAYIIYTRRGIKEE